MIKGDKCAHQFCWRCLNGYTQILDQGNLGHKESCSYRNATLPNNALLDPEGYLDEEGNPRPWVRGLLFYLTIIYE